jgi:hypothetical protein
VSFTSPFAPFAPPGGSGSSSLPFGGETPYGFAIPQGSPSEIEAAAGLAAAISSGWGMHADYIKTGSQAALGSWRGPAQAAFEERAGALISALNGNSQALGRASDAMQKLAHALESAQKACKQAAEQCDTETKAVNTAQGQADQHGRDAQTLTQQAAQAAHPAMQSQLMNQARDAQNSQINAQNAANAATNRLNDAKQAGVRAANAYNTEAEALSRQIAASHAQLKALPHISGGVPVPIPITAADRKLAKKLLAAASGLPMPKDGNIGKALSHVAGGPLTPGTILALQQDAAEAQRELRHESTLDRVANNVVDVAGGATNYVTFGGVSFGNPNSPAYKAGEGMAAVPIDPEALGEDAAHVAEDAGVHLAEDGSHEALPEAFHYTSSRYTESIKQEGLIPGSYLTPNGELSPLQAQIELALPPTRDLPDAALSVDLAGMRKAGFEIPPVTRVSNVVRASDGRVYTMPGGGYEMHFPYAIPARFIKVVR